MLSGAALEVVPKPELDLELEDEAVPQQALGSEGVVHAVDDPLARRIEPGRREQVRVSSEDGTAYPDPLHNGLH